MLLLTSMLGNCKGLQSHNLSLQLFTLHIHDENMKASRASLSNEPVCCKTRGGKQSGLTTSISYTVHTKAHMDQTAYSATL